MVFKKYSIHLVILVVLLIMSSAPEGFSQEDTLQHTAVLRDTIKLNESAVEDPVVYSAKDSIYSDLKKRQVHLFNEAMVDNGTVKIKAGYILIDLDKNEVYASYIYDADSNKIQRPVFTDGSEEIEAASIRYNFDTKKGYIEEVAIQQDENHLYMAVAKRHSDEQIHFLRGRFTTCDLEEPHYHFQLSKAVMIPNKRIVSGPMNLWVRGVPTPVGLPFIIIPQVDEDKTKGLIFPQIAPISPYGFGFQDLGYYWPINDRIQTTFFGSLYSRGTWGIRNNTEYLVRYRFGGKIDLNFQQFNKGFPTNQRLNKFSINWTHLTDPKSSPYWRFNSSVMFMSDNNSKNNLDPTNPTYFNNTFNSDINLMRMFPGKPITAGLKLGLKQNSTSKNISLTAPVLNVNVTRVLPFKNLFTKQNALSRIGVTYSFEGQNRSTFADTLLSAGDFTRIGEQFKNGIDQKMTLQTTISLFRNTVKVTPSINYENRMNFQQIRKELDTSGAVVNIDTAMFGSTHFLNFSAQATTVVYSYYRFVGKKQPLLRHVMTPTISFQYKPVLNRMHTDPNGNAYSYFQSSLYSSGTERSQALLNFGLNNTFELKHKSDKDTITGFKKVRLIDALSISGSYDLLKDAMNLSDFRISMRVSPASWLNVVINSTFSPYGWDSNTGVQDSEYAVKSNGKLGRFTANSFATTLTLTSKESREKLQSQVSQIEKNWNADYEYFLLHPEHAVNFTIPWKVSFSHVYSLNLNSDTTTYINQRWNQLQTVMINGDLSITKRWKLVSAINVDIKESMVTNARFSLTRDMHCWALAFTWTPIGGNKSFLFTIRSTSTLFQDAKIQLKKPPAFL